MLVAQTHRRDPSLWWGNFIVGDGVVVKFHRRSPSLWWGNFFVGDGVVGFFFRMGKLGKRRGKLCFEARILRDNVAEKNNRREVVVVAEKKFGEVVWWRLKVRREVVCGRQTNRRDVVWWR